jgi:hypothetical protein
MVFTQTKALKIGGKEHSECPIYLVMGLGYEGHFLDYLSRANKLKLKPTDPNLHLYRFDNGILLLAAC